jgi:hypothetical protein
MVMFLLFFPSNNWLVTIICSSSRSMMKKTCCKCLLFDPLLAPLSLAVVFDLLEEEPLLDDNVILE